MYSRANQDNFWNASLRGIEAGMTPGDLKRLTAQQNWHTAAGTHIDAQTRPVDLYLDNSDAGDEATPAQLMPAADGVLCSPALPCTEVFSLLPMCICISCLF
jgi:hypothetical protein